MLRIDDDALSVLRGAWCEGDTLFLPKDELPRDTYERVNEVVTRLGGKWKGGRVRGHVFAHYDPAPLLAATVATGEMPPKNPTAFFPTPGRVIDLLLSMVNDPARIPAEAMILEPSAGTGAIADAIVREAAKNDAIMASHGLPYRWRVDCCEVLPVNRAVLEAKGHRLVGDDFTQWNPGAIYDAVLMNPPFSLEGDPQAYVTHILHAWDLLKPGGVLGAIVPRGWQFREDRRSAQFMDLVCDFGEWEDVDAGAFKESGTMVATSVVSFEKSNVSWRSLPRHGHLNWHVWEFGLTSDNDAPFSRKAYDIAKRATSIEDKRAEYSGLCSEFAREMRRAGSCVRLRTEELDALWREFVSGYGLEEERQSKPRPTTCVDAELGGLFTMAA